MTRIAPMNTCSTCANWISVAPDDCDAPFGECKKMLNCVCCSGGDQLAGSNGGGQFRCRPEFGCVLWEAK